MQRTVIVVGASRGIGLATAQALLESGARVVAVQRALSPALRSLGEQYADSFRIVLGDFTDESTIHRALTASPRPVHGLVFNAASIGGIKPIAELSIEEWREAFDVNVFGVVRFLQAALRRRVPALAKDAPVLTDYATARPMVVDEATARPVLADDARVIFISSTAAEEVAWKAAGPYCASKAALNSLSRTLAAEHPSKVCIALHPGSVDTEMHTDFVDQAMPHNRDALSAPYEKIEPERPGRVIARLALGAPRELSGRYLHWDDPVLGQEGIAVTE